VTYAKSLVSNGINGVLLHFLHPDDRISARPEEESESVAKESANVALGKVYDRGR
jgi:hypothetical protein